MTYSIKAFTYKKQVPGGYRGTYHEKSDRVYEDATGYSIVETLPSGHSKIIKTCYDAASAEMEIRLLRGEVAL